MGESFLQWVAQLPGGAVYAVLVGLSALENIFPPVPADIAVVLGAFLGRQGIVSAPLLGLLCWLGNTASSAGMYFYARAHGRRFFATGWRSKLMPPEANTALEKAYARHGVYGLLVSRFLPRVRAAVTPVAGMAGMPARRSPRPRSPPPSRTRSSSPRSALAHSSPRGVRRREPGAAIVMARPSPRALLVVAACRRPWN